MKRIVGIGVFWLAAIAGNHAAADPDILSVTNTLAGSRALGPSTARTPLTITEIMYHPAAAWGTNGLEYVELYNSGPLNADISGFRLSGDIDYTFPSGTVLTGRTFLLVAADPAAAIGHYGISRALGPWSGALPDGGGVVRLRNRQGALLLDVVYADRMPWPIAADGAGHALVLNRPDYGENSVLAWTASRWVGGSPAAADPENSQALDALGINEFLAHTDPDTDAIELYNASTQVLDISGCVLTDNVDDPGFVLPTNTVLGPRTCVYFLEATLGFRLSKGGDDILLLNPPRTRVLDAVRFDAQQNGVATGRFPDGAPGLHELTAPTLGSANTNAALRIRDVVVNEIMFHPISGLAAEEYVELFNRGTGTVSIGNWRFMDGIDWILPPGTVIPAGGFLVVAADAERLRARYPQLNTANTIGDFAGDLSDRGGRVALAMPEDPLQPYSAYVVVDEVTYGDGWGAWVDGDGSSLELIDPHADNRLADNWMDSDETAKAPWTTIERTTSLQGGEGAINELHLFFQNGAECLVDNIAIIANGTTNFSAKFESGIGAWEIGRGNHIRSKWRNTEGDGSSASFQLIGSSRGDSRFSSSHGVWEDIWNRATAVLPLPLSAGQTVTIRARARWLAGWPILNMALEGYWMDVVGALNLPATLGSPGLVNSRWRGNAGPAMADVRHDPVLPSALESVLVSARVHDPDGIRNVSLRYRVDGTATSGTVAMVDSGLAGDLLAGDGIFSGVLPGQTAGKLIAFTVEAADGAASAVTNVFPREAPAREALVRFGDSAVNTSLGVYRLWLTATNLTIWNTRHVRSNEPIDGTFVYGNWRAIYNAGGRYRGGWRTFNGPTGSISCSYVFTTPARERFLGDTEMKLDTTGPYGDDDSHQRERHGYWLAEQIGLPFSSQRYTQVILSGSVRELMYHTQMPSSEFFESWYGDKDPRVYRLYKDRPLTTVYPDIRASDGTPAYETYRWRFHKSRARVPNDDFSPLHTIALAMTNENDALYIPRMNALVDTDEWLGWVALNHVMVETDSWGYQWPHNVFFYVPRDRRAIVVKDDLDYSFIQSTSDDLFRVDVGTEIPRMLNSPVYQRAYWSWIKQTVNGPWQSALSNPQIDARYAVILANNHAVSSSQTSAIKSWMTGRNSYVQSQLAALPSVFAITSNGGVNFSTNAPVLTLSGTAPVDVRRFMVNGVEQSAVAFVSLSTWQLRVGLKQGANPITVEGYDRLGILVASDTITVTLSVAPPSPLGQLVINEIMYNPAVPDAGFVEIYNRSNTDSFDLRGWRMDGVGLTFPGGAIVKPGQHAVVAANLPVYQTTYGNAEMVLSEYPGALDDGGETLRLLMPGATTDTWVTVNEVAYDDGFPWPAQADGGGASLQLRDPAQDNNRAGDWAAPEATALPQWRYRAVTGVLSNAHPTVIAATRLRLYLQNAGTARIDRLWLCTGTVAQASANLLGNGDFESPLGGAWLAAGTHATSAAVAGQTISGSAFLQLTATASGNFSNSVSQGGLGLVGGRTYTLSYWYEETAASNVLAVGLDGASVGATQNTLPPPLGIQRYSPGAPNSVIEALPPLIQVWINEIMPSNAMALADNAGEFDPWIELRNADMNAADLTGFWLSNDFDDPLRWAFPTGTVVAAGERLLVWADAAAAQTAPGYLHASFGLNPTGGVVVLTRGQAGNTVMLDAITYGNLGADVSLGRWPEDNGTNLRIMQSPSPGFPNAITSMPIRVRINEWMADNKSTLLDASDGNFEDWFELYNPDPQPVYLTGCALTDRPAESNRFYLPPGAWIGPRAFLVIWADGDAGVNQPGMPLHADFSLNRAGESLGLYAPDGGMIDAVAFGPQDKDRSEGRWPDGALNVFPMLAPTPEASNRVLRILGTVTSAPGTFAVQLAVTPDSAYDISYVQELRMTNWAPLITVTSAANTTVLNIIDPVTAGVTQRFYKVREIR